MIKYILLVQWIIELPSSFQRTMMLSYMIYEILHVITLH
jgi:HJR/Mrr/RecB family endonuclease